ISITSLMLMLLTTVACSPNSTINSASLTQIPEPQETPNPEQTIVLGDISDNPRKKIRKFQPLANYLSTNLSQFDRGKVKVAPDLETMISWLKTGEVDIYIDSPYPAMMAISQANAKPILRRWKKGDAEYHALIFTLSDRNINFLADLTGKTVAFDHPASTTGFMLPLSKILESGLSPQEVKSANSSVAADQVGYVFSHEDKNSIEWLLGDKVAAAAIDNHTYDKIPTAIKEKTVILAETETIARNVVLVQQNMSPDVIEDLSATLLAMEETASGKAVLDQFGQTTRFDNFPVEENLARMQELYQQAQK
ncbi:MAG: phosphate/phosphite/phosphonate ABC transporter substrate-binding protein, partial [Cyanobacteria bacterium P01_E01_bin.35]